MCPIKKEYCLDSEYLDEQILDTFGKYLMIEVRDKAIDSYVQVINEIMTKKDEESADYQVLRTFTEDQMSFLMRLIPYLVDSAIFYILQYGIIEEYRINIMIGLADTQKLNFRDINDGLGELYSEDGWIDMFSKRDTFFTDNM